ncbi:hypothetical protein LEP1GSC059_0430 [Leptospira noguchii serovar Panama str. CZ214]|uniref:Uncharacterized protein n=1 Tax=Leptospira noguchii serovar Panama str. CZ214 TaxID=1001595 RepID=T0FJD0_9LEPT|nr:hypothetical protein LEP1GSC059_0430 [Leptospira noguchii serovar Panama str. CZ214]
MFQNGIIKKVQAVRHRKKFELLIRKELKNCRRSSDVTETC